MRKVYQRVVDPEKGDCYRAAVASILDLDLDDVPEDIGHNPWSEFAFLQARRLCAIHLDEHRLKPLPEGAELSRRRKVWDTRDMVRYDYAEGAVGVASVPSQRFPGGWHAIVVGFVGQPEGWVRVECLHDPNPGNAPYDLDVTRIRALTFYTRAMEFGTRAEPESEAPP